MKKALLINAVRLIGGDFPLDGGLVADGLPNDHKHCEDDANHSGKQGNDAKRQEQAVEWRVLIDREV